MLVLAVLASACPHLGPARTKLRRGLRTKRITARRKARNGILRWGPGIIHALALADSAGSKAQGECTRNVTAVLYSTVC